QLKPRQVRSQLKVAIGIAVPAIEAWYLAGRDRQVGEAAWKSSSQAGKRPLAKSHIKQLKLQVYGTERPSLERETECAVNEVRRIIGKLQAIEAAFPMGFGLMAQQIRGWIPKEMPGGN